MFSFGPVDGRPRCHGGGTPVRGARPPAPSSWPRVPAHPCATTNGAAGSAYFSAPAVPDVGAAASGLPAGPPPRVLAGMFTVAGQDCHLLRLDRDAFGVPLAVALYLRCWQAHSAALRGTPETNPCPAGQHQHGIVACSAFGRKADETILPRSTRVSRPSDLPYDRQHIEQASSSPAHRPTDRMFSADMLFQR